MQHTPIPGAAADLDFASRPGVPMEHSPQPLPGARVPILPQRSDVLVFKHVGRARFPPVFGTAQPPRGLSGLLRKQAYRFPDHLARHWLTLMFADRVDVWEHRLRGGLSWGLPVLGVLSLSAWGLRKLTTR
ncbi:hypothetical protein LZ198_04540 [Myxococcus sp. K15C18031901]|uniref:hypothetical protein n=1 Tax=Myxococcus dinghuensis TaxID=2906761 RepID=UPI0020A7C908|nr:hypothetical protein [Myxococcus dinghuensis]MCP3098144.1 hypothetical protein [Myxococcus dinghuensis]